ncbi:MAG: 16S rRNA (adenine(1518)-N(6)/adenine(1519)-N(6))-dimethyltransferase RsmA [Planctomycetota bacterium]
MQSVAEIRALLEERGLRPKKSLGQNFLIDQNLLTRLVDEAGVVEGDVVLEVGPGTGTLTEALLARGARVVAVELDDQLAGLLRDRLGAHEGFTLVHGDCLASKREVSPAVLDAVRDAGGSERFKLVANLPYHAATPLMLTLMSAHPACVSMAVTIQREVAERMVAGPGSKTFGTLGVVAGALGSARKVAVLGPGCFWPAPGVESAMAVWERGRALVGDGVGQAVGFAGFVSRVFEGRRKQLGAHLKRLGMLPSAWPEGVVPTDRAESLDVRRFAALYGAVMRTGDDG